MKNATLLDGDVLRFPDAVSARATKHVRELAKAARAGDRAVLFFHVGHEGGSAVSLAEHVDPVYASAVRAAVVDGVEVVAYRAKMTATAIDLAAAVRVVL